MSFQLNTATALPSEVQLGKEKPQGAFCLRSRYSLSANTASSWSAGTTLSIPLQTGTPGTFTDVKQGIIQATVEIYNTNPYVDYVNFGPSGAMILFDEMRVYSSGTPIEENLRYSETADLLHTQPGHQTKPFQVYRRNKWRAMNGQAGKHHINFVKPSMVDSLGVPMFGRTPFMDKNSSVYCAPSIAYGSLLNDPITGGASGNGFFRVGPSGISQNGTSFSGPLLGLKTFDDSAIVENLFSVSGNQAGGSVSGYVNDAVAEYIGTHRKTRRNDRIGARGNADKYNTQYGIFGAPGTVPVANTPAAIYTPAQWPDYQPCTLNGEFDDTEIDSLIGKCKMSEYFKYLCNVRSLPVGLKGSPVTNGYQRDSAALAPVVASQGSGATNGSFQLLQYRVSMPFLSGIYGIFAEKMFPDMLIGANNIRIEFKLAQNVKALWTTMDPCRRVPGTMRDFVPFTGSKSGVPRTTLDQDNSAFGCTLLRLDVENATASTANGFFQNSQIYGDEACCGTDFFPQMVMTQSSSISLVPTVRDGNGAVTSSYTSSHNSRSGNFTAFGPDAQTNLPRPQYIPCATPWLKGDGIAAAPQNTTYINENASCFGTYLPASQPQTRRSTSNTKLNAIGDSYASSGQTTFAIRDIQYIGEQVQLDDVVTSAIIQSAATSEIVVFTRGYRSFEASCDQNTQQNIILPIQIGQAEALYLLFRPPVITQSTDYYSNSFSCPFVGLSFENSSQEVKDRNEGVIPDVGGKYTLNSSLDASGSGAFSYQLFSGTKQYPLQPIQSVSELITEREKSVHALHNWDWTASDLMSLVKWDSRYGNRSSKTGLDYDPFIDGGYFTTFVPVLALDDQSITQNPYFQLAELLETGGSNALAARIRGRRCPAALTTENDGSSGGVSFYGVLNEFTTPIANFFLGWDFESWTNHQDVMRTGKFLGQEQISIRMTGTYLCTAQNVLAPGQQAQGQNIMCTAIVPHVVKLSFIPGGHLLSYY
jgi:hypothetical protein